MPSCSETRRLLRLVAFGVWSVDGYSNSLPTQTKEFAGLPFTPGTIFLSLSFSLSLSLSLSLFPSLLSLMLDVRSFQRPLLASVSHDGGVSGSFISLGVGCYITSVPHEVV